MMIRPDPAIPDDDAEQERALHAEIRCPVTLTGVARAVIRAFGIKSSR
jgi:hypothetical protein